MATYEKFISVRPDVGSSWARRWSFLGIYEQFIRVGIGFDDSWVPTDNV